MRKKHYIAFEEDELEALKSKLNLSRSGIKTGGDINSLENALRKIDNSILAAPFTIIKANPLPPEELEKLRQEWNEMMKIVYLSTTPYVILPQVGFSKD